MVQRSTVLRSTTAEGLRDAEHDQLGERDAFDKQQRAIGTEDAERALGFACPIGRQDTGGRFDEAKFASAAAVKSEASHNQVPTMMMKAPSSATALKLPRPTHRHQGDCPARHGW